MSFYDQGLLVGAESPKEKSIAPGIASIIVVILGIIAAPKILNWITR